MTTIRMFAGTDVGLRDNNEDNFTVCPDLGKGNWVIPDPAHKITLGELGCIMVVADGMGGQNAGEVASAIAVQTVEEMFSRQHLPANVSDSPASIKSYLRKTIVEADTRIKRSAETESDMAGMGSTIVMVWVINGMAYVAWLGDSRAYSYIPSKGIGRLSKDHSYVQQLVDSGAITDEEAMVHPQSNVITRSLGDTSQKAKPDVTEFPITDGEILLLCSDGLCGVCADEVIGGIIEENCDDLRKCKDALTEAALDAGGSDNISIALLSLQTDGKAATARSTYRRSWIKPMLICLLAFVIVAAAIVISVFSKKDVNMRRNETQLSLSLSQSTIKPGEKVRFSLIHSEGDCQIDYNRKLLYVDFTDSTVSVVKGAMIQSEVVTPIKACLLDSVVQVSLKIIPERKNVVNVNDIIEEMVETTLVEDPPEDQEGAIEKKDQSNELTPSDAPGSTLNETGKIM